MPWTENEGGASSHSATKPTPSIKFPSDEKEDEENMEKNDAHNQTNPNNDNNDNNKPKNNDDNDHSDSNKPTNTDSDINKVHESVKTDSGSSPWILSGAIGYLWLLGFNHVNA